MAGSHEDLSKSEHEHNAVHANDFTGRSVLSTVNLQVKACLMG